MGTFGNFLYRPSYGASGQDEYDKFDAGLSKADEELTNAKNHREASTGVHGVGSSTIESTSGSQAKVNTHASETTGVHGVGASTVDSVANRDSAIEIHRASATHGTAQPVTVRKNSGTDIGTRKRLNLIEGSNVTLTVSDDATDDEIDVTITATGGGGGGTRKINFPASCFETRVAEGWASFVQTWGTNFDYGELYFGAFTDRKAISPPFRLTGWGGGNITVRIGFKANATSGNVMWVVSFLGIDTTTPEAWDAAFTDHALSAVTVPSTPEYLKEAVWTGTPTELANNDVVIMKITRDADSAGDTLMAVAKLLYVEIEY